jgi:hypothetical protein
MCSHVQSFLVKGVSEQDSQYLRRAVRFRLTAGAKSRVKATVGNNEPPDSEYENDQPGSPDPNDSDLLRDQLKGETVEHAKPPRLEDEGQSGG